MIIDKNRTQSGTPAAPLEPKRGDGDMDVVHRLVQNETAKTILLNVPLELNDTSCGGKSSSPKMVSAPIRKLSCGLRSPSVAASSSPAAASLSSCKSRVRSASVGRDKQSDTQARYWAFLFENLRRAVDDLYRTCESDDSIPAVKEVIMVFENYVKDFKNLANWLKLNREYENTPPPQRPNSLTWEVRKTPPAGRLTPTSVLMAQRIFMALPAKRALDFDDKSVEKVIKEVEVTPVKEKENDKEKPSQTDEIAKTTTSLSAKVDKTTAPPEKRKASSVSRTAIRSAACKPHSSAAAASPRPVASPSNTGQPAPRLASSVIKRSISSHPTSSSILKSNSGASKEKSNRVLPAATTHAKPGLMVPSHRLGSVLSNRVVKAHPVRATRNGPNQNVTVSKNVVDAAIDKFGSNLSIRSNHSDRSWADTVKGMHRSVDDVAAMDEVAFQPTNPSTNPDDDSIGWETVKPRTRSKCSPSSSSSSVKSKVRYSAKTRFQMPTSAASLPSMALLSLEEDSKGSKSSVKVATPSPKVRRMSSNLERVQESSSSDESTYLSSNTIMKFKSKSLSPKVMAKNTKSQIQSPPDSDRDESSEVMEAEIAKRDVAIALAEEEERNLALEIQEMEKSEMPTDPDSSDDYELNKRGYTKLFEGFAWSEEVDLDDQLQESRYPGRAMQLHEKLSSPARKREPQETFRHHQEKQERAKLRRQKFHEEKAQKLLALNTRIEEVIAQKEQLISEKRDMMNHKMAKAEQKRQEHIDGIRKKAREEDAKLKEIAFINELQAQNSRIDQLVQNQAADEKAGERLAELAEERAKKQEQREAKEQRAEERRRAMEEERLRNMELLKERIRSREERILEEQQQARKEREEAAREKARDREEKLFTVRAAERDMKEELHEKIQIKQQEAARRHQEKLEYIRQKAFELSMQKCWTDESLPQLKPYQPKKKCNLCNVLINNEVHLHSHLRGKSHGEKVNQSLNGHGSKLAVQNSEILRHIIDAKADDQDPKLNESKERSKAMKKRAKKLKTRMLARAVQYESALPDASKIKYEAPNRAKIGKSLRDIEKLMCAQGKGAWPNNMVSSLERSLGEIVRTLEKGHVDDKLAFYCWGGFNLLFKFFSLLAEQKQSCVVPLKSISLCCKTWSLACLAHRHNIDFVLNNNYLAILVDILMDRLNVLLPNVKVEDFDLLPPQHGPQFDPVARSIMYLLCQALEDLCQLLKEAGQRPELKTYTLDFISYIVSVGVVDKLAAYFSYVQDPIDGSRPEVGHFLLCSLQLMSALTGIVESANPESSCSQSADPTNLWSALRITDLAGTVSMLYGILLHQGRSSTDNQDPPDKLPDHTLNVACATLQLLHRIIRQRLSMVQEVLGQEGISLEFRHIASYLLRYSQHHGESSLLHQTIILVGYFAARHVDNQTIVQSGQQPSVLQQLCNLPFPFFSQPHLKKILFPTLLACCHKNQENMGILTEEMNWQLIKDFLDSPDGKCLLVDLVLSE